MVCHIVLWVFVWARTMYLPIIKYLFFHKIEGICIILLSMRYHFCSFKMGQTCRKYSVGIEGDTNYYRYDTNFGEFITLFYAIFLGLTIGIVAGFSDSAISLSRRMKTLYFAILFIYFTGSSINLATLDDFSAAMAREEKVF